MDKIRKMEPILNHLPKSPVAEVRYELLSDALVWSDECPEFGTYPDGDLIFLRGLWRFRTSLMNGNAEERFRSIWDEGLVRFPDWPGFSPERCGAHWRETFVAARSKAIDDWEMLDQRFE